MLDQRLRHAAIRRTGATLVVQAGYGLGKSHLGRLGRELALEHGLMTMDVELDGAGLSLWDGKGVIASLFGSLMIPSVLPGRDGERFPSGLGSLLTQAGRIPDVQLNNRLAMFAPFLRCADRWLESEAAVKVLEDYLSGERSRDAARYRLRELLNEDIALQASRLAYGTVEERQGAQVDQLVRVVELGVAAGAKGALIVLDELDHDLADWRRRERIGMMLATFSARAKKAPIVLLLLARDDAALALPEAEDLKLDSFSRSEFRLVVDKVIDAYAGLYPAPALDRGRDALFEKLHRLYTREFAREGWGPRFFVRATVEACEAARHRVQLSLGDVEVG